VGNDRGNRILISPTAMIISPLEAVVMSLATKQSRSEQQSLGYHEWAPAFCALNTSAAATSVAL
jgi:hypothetical protein